MLFLRVLLFFVVNFCFNFLHASALNLKFWDCLSDPAITSKIVVVSELPSSAAHSTLLSVNSIDGIDKVALSMSTNSLLAHKNHELYFSQKKPMSLYEELQLAKKIKNRDFINPYAQKIEDSAKVDALTERVRLKSNYADVLEEERILMRMKQKAKQDQITIECEEIKSLVALAIAIFSDDQKKNLQNVINDQMDCGKFFDKGISHEKSKDSLKEEPFFNKRHSNYPISYQDRGNNYSNFSPNDRTVRLGDIIENGVQYKQYVFVDEKGQYTVGYLESYDGKQGGLFCCIEPQAIPLSKSVQAIHDLQAYHSGSVKQMKIHALTNSPVTQGQIVDDLCRLGKITKEQAIQFHKQIEFNTKSAQARDMIKQFEKSQNPSFMKKAFHGLFGKHHEQQQSNTTNSHQSVNNQRAPVDTSFKQPTHVSKSNTTSTTSNNATCPSVDPVPVPVDSVSPSASLASTSVDSSFSPHEKTSPECAHTVTKPREEKDSFTGAMSSPLLNSTNLPSFHDENITDHQFKNSEKVKIKNQRDQLLEAQDRWMQKIDFSNVHPQEARMVQQFLDAIVDAKNDTVIEIAQSGLKAWQQAREAQTEELEKYNLKKAQLYHDAIGSKKQIQSIAEYRQSIKAIELDNLLQDYNVAIKMHDDTQNSDFRQIAKTPLRGRLEKRVQALSRSKEQLRIYKALPTRSYKISEQARNFMMENNMNYATFDSSLPLTDFQDCLTQEIVGIIESSANIAQYYDSQSTMGKIINYNCNLAISAQQLNETSLIKEATAIVDFSHFFNAYAEILHNSQLYSPHAVDIHVGFMEGTVRAVWAWKDFVTNLIAQPRQTIGKITQDCQAVGSFLYNVIAKAHEFMPDAYLKDMMQDMQEKLKKLQNHHNSTNFDGPSRMMQRSQRNAEYLQDGLRGSLQVAQSMFEEAMKRSLRQNVALGTEIIVDNMIAGKATDYLLKLSSLVGNQALSLVDQINQNLPPHLGNVPVNFIETTAGEVIAVAEGENIGIAMAKQFAENKADQIFKNGIKAKELSEKINKITKPDPVKIKEFEESLKPFLNDHELINVGRLQSIEGIEQIDKFKKYTNNFHPDELAKLKSEEILYLNLCDWLEPQAKAINDEIKAMKGLKFIDSATKTEVVIYEFDLFHSLLGEMTPGNLKDCVSGGHLLILELRAATLEIGEITIFGDGFLDMFVSVRSNRKYNSCFPVGTSVKNSVDMVKDAIKNYNKIFPIKLKNQASQGFNFINQKGQGFSIIIENNIARFYPSKGA